MMLDKDQIEGWDSESEEPEKAKPKRNAKPVASAAPPAEARVEGEVPEPVMTTQPDPPAGPPEASPQRGGIAGAIFDSRQAVPTGETVKITPEQAKIRRRRARWTALALFAFAVLIFLITIAKLGPQILVRDL